MLPTVKVSRPKGFLLGKLVHHVHICCIPSPSSRSTKLKTSQLWPFVTRRWCYPSWYAHKLLKYMQEGKDILLRFCFDLITSPVPTPRFTRHFRWHRFPTRRPAASLSQPYALHVRVCTYPNRIQGTVHRKVSPCPKTPWFSFVQPTRALHEM